MAQKQSGEGRKGVNITSPRGEGWDRMGLLAGDGAKESEPSSLGKHSQPGRPSEPCRPSRWRPGSPLQFAHWGQIDCPRLTLRPVRGIASEESLLDAPLESGVRPQR